MLKIPTTVVTGFLGSGKTTLIRSLLHNTLGLRLAVIVNEFGDVGLDGDLLSSCGAPGCAEDDIIELANGCICCTVADDFLPTMAQLLDRPSPPDHILVETSGLALPKPLLKAFTWPAVRTRATVDGVIAVIDSLAVAEGQFEAEPWDQSVSHEPSGGAGHDYPLNELFQEQLGAADLVVMNKTDLLNHDDLARAERLVRQRLRPQAGLLRCAFGDLDPRLLLGLGVAAEDDLQSRPSEHETQSDHDHDDFESFVFKTGEVRDRDDLSFRLGQVLGGPCVLRLKGVIAVSDKRARLIVQAVGPRVDTYYDRGWRPEEIRLSRLVVIGLRGMDRRDVEAQLQAALS